MRHLLLGCPPRRCWRQLLTRLVLSQIVVARHGPPSPDGEDQEANVHHLDLQGFQVGAQSMENTMNVSRNIVSTRS